MGARRILACLLVFAAAAHGDAESTRLKNEADAARDELSAFETSLAKSGIEKRLHPVTDRDSEALRGEAGAAMEEYRRLEPLARFRVPGIEEPTKANDKNDSDARSLPRLRSIINLQPFRSRDSHRNFDYLENEIPRTLAGIIADTPMVSNDPAAADVVVSGEYWVRDGEFIARAYVRRGWRRAVVLQWTSPEPDVSRGAFDWKTMAAEIVEAANR